MGITVHLPSTDATSHPSITHERGKAFYIRDGHLYVQRTCTPTRRPTRWRRTPRACGSAPVATSSDAAQACGPVTEAAVEPPSSMAGRPSLRWSQDRVRATSRRTTTRF